MVLEASAELVEGIVAGVMVLEAAVELVEGIVAGIEVFV